MQKYYCYYCGRLQRYCSCATPDSRLQQFLAVSRFSVNFCPCWRLTPYIRAVPPQIKRARRAQLRAHYRAWLRSLVEEHGHACLHCGSTADLVLDHIVPIALGGLSIVENLQLLCRRCNALKGKLVYDCRPCLNNE